MLRLGAALAKLSPHILVLGPTGLTNVDGAAHARKRRMQNPPFHAGVLANYEATVRRITENALTDWPYGRSAPSLPLMRTIALEVIIATVFGMTDPARAQRLRAATRALLHEGESRRFLVQTMIASSRPGGWDRPVPADARRHRRRGRRRARRARRATSRGRSGTAVMSSRC